jgi:hypothetical protein
MIKIKVPIMTALFRDPDVKFVRDPIRILELSIPIFGTRLSIYITEFFRRTVLDPDLSTVTHGIES